MGRDRENERRRKIEIVADISMNGGLWMLFLTRIQVTVKQFKSEIERQNWDTGKKHWFLF